MEQVEPTIIIGGGNVGHVAISASKGHQPRGKCRECTNKLSKMVHTKMKIANPQSQRRELEAKSEDEVLQARITLPYMQMPHRAVIRTF